MKEAFLFTILALALNTVTGSPAATRSGSSFPVAVSEPSAAVGLLLVPSGGRSAPALYAKYCASCHGRDGRSKTLKGKFNHSRDLTDSTWQGNVADERIFNSIMNGKGRKMPGYSKKLSEQEIDSLVAFVRGLKR